jgi:hypothetical protein
VGEETERAETIIRSDNNYAIFFGKFLAIVRLEDWLKLRTKRRVYPESRGRQRGGVPFGYPDIEFQTVFGSGPPQVGEVTWHRESKASNLDSAAAVSI